MRLSLLLRESRKEVAVRSVDRVNTLRGERLSQRDYAYLVRFGTTLLVLLADRIEDEGFGEIWHFLDRSSKEAADYGMGFGTLLKMVSFLRLEVLEPLKERTKIADASGAPTEEEKELLSAQFDPCISKIVDSFERQIAAAATLPGSSAEFSDKAGLQEDRREKGRTTVSSVAAGSDVVRSATYEWERHLRDSVIAALSSGVTFGLRMKELRRSQKITLHSLAARLGFARGYISNIENGKTIPSFTAISAISKVLDPGGSRSLILLGMIERLPQEVREILISGREGRGRAAGEDNLQQEVMPPAESECDEDVE